MAVELRAGVGTNRPNHRQDVATVQLFLGVAVDGVFGGQTSAALATFQNARFGFTDGFCDPGDITYKLLRGDLDDSDSALMRGVVHSALNDPLLSPTAIEEVPSADGQGLVTTWSHGEGIAKIFSHHTWGTWDVRGLILARYLELDEERGPLGWPISGERAHGNGGRASFFQHGRITWDPPNVAAVETIVPD